MPNTSCLMGLFLPVCTIGNSGMYLTPTLIQAPCHALGTHRQIRCTPCPRERRWGKNGKRGHWHTQGEGYSHLMPNVGYTASQTLQHEPLTSTITAQLKHTHVENQPNARQGPRERDADGTVPYVFSLVQSSEKINQFKNL